MPPAKPRDRRHVLFDLGEFVVDPEVTELLSYADVNQLVQRHGRGDWGRVNAVRKQMNNAFIHPKARMGKASAESVHIVRNTVVCIQTKQDKGRRKTLLFLL